MVKIMLHFSVKNDLTLEERKKTNFSGLSLLTVPGSTVNKSVSKYLVLHSKSDLPVRLSSLL